MLATVGNPQPSMRNGLNECLPIWNVVGAPTLWVYYGADLSLTEKENARIYAEKLAALINQDAKARAAIAKVEGGE